MEPTWVEATEWNIFARELAHILAARGLRLGHLDDRKVVFQPEKIRRLQKSLKSPAHFPVLNPEELGRLYATFDLSEEEKQRLRAAIIATAAERTLMDRLPPTTALMAANDVFEICLAAMRDKPIFEEVMAGTASDGAEESDAESWEALDLLDEATFALHGAGNAPGLASRRAQARAALVAFERVIALLNASGTQGNTDDAWQSRLAEAEEGRKQAEALLRKTE